MASDLIKRDSIRAAVALYMGSNAYLNDTALDVLKMIDKWLCEAEAVDAEPVRHGEWIKMVFTDSGKFAGYKCSECGLIAKRKFSYCHCGAKMEKNHVQT